MRSKSSISGNSFLMSKEGRPLRDEVGAARTSGGAAIGGNPLVMKKKENVEGNAVKRKTKLLSGL